MTQFKSWFNLFFVAIALLFSADIIAQNNINSPYTRFGYGRLNDLGFSRNQAMGGLGYALRTRQNINPANPASFSSIDSTSFIFEFGASGLFSDFASAEARQTTFTANLEYLAFQVPITKWLGLSAGMVPYSFIGYEYGSSDSIAMPGYSASSYQTNFYGKGGISQIYLGLSASLFNHLALGVSAYYLYGDISYYRALIFMDESAAKSTVRQASMFTQGFNLQYGIQYFHTFAKKHELVVGFVYDHQSKLHNTLEVSTLGVDTAQTTTKPEFELPNMYAGGIAYTYDKRLTVGADFTFQEFAKIKYYNVTDTLNNRAKLSIGTEYIHRPSGNRFIDRMQWRLGVFYSQSYVKMGTGKTNNFGVTCGIGIPLKTTKTMLNLNFEYGNIDNPNNKKFSENYYKIGINVNLNELWFFKPRIQ